MQIELTIKEKEHLILSLVVRLGFIETGTMNRAKDLINIGQKDKIKVLSTEQMRGVVELEDLLTKILNC